MLTQVIGPKTKEIEVGGVFKTQPFNSSFQEQAYMHFDNLYDDGNGITETDWKTRTTLFVLIEDDARVAAVQTQLQTYRENSNKVREDFLIKEFLLDPFVGMARRDMANNTWSMTRSSSPTAAVISPVIMVFSYCLLRVLI